MHNNIIIIQRPAVLGREREGGKEEKIMKEGTVEREGKKSEGRESK